MTTSAPVPAEGQLRLGTVRLPAGRLLRSQGGMGEPVAWRTQAPVAEPGPVWSALSVLQARPAWCRSWSQSAGAAIFKPGAGTWPQSRT
jgi:hypothetical protein